MAWKWLHGGGGETAIAFSAGHLRCWKERPKHEVVASDVDDTDVGLKRCVQKCEPGDLDSGVTDDLAKR